MAEIYHHDIKDIMNATLRKMLRAKLHRIKVTHADRDYEGSIALPKALLRAGDFLPGEAVQIWNVTTGTRFETYIIEGGEDDGLVAINGAAAHLAKPGDIIIVAAFVMLPEAEARAFEPLAVFVDEHNRIREIRGEKHPLGQSVLV